MRLLDEPGKDVTDNTPESADRDGEPADVDAAAAPRTGLISSGSSTLPDPPIDIDIATARPARMGDYLLGGKANFSVDRDVIEHITAALPGGSDAARATVHAAQEFRHRAVRYLAVEAGIRQFLHISARMPMDHTTHHVAQAFVPDSRVVYVIDDDVVLAHANLLKEGSAEGTTAYIRGDLRHPKKIAGLAAETLNVTEPIGVIVLSGAMNVIDSDDDMHAAIATLLHVVRPGSYLMITHLASDLVGGTMTEAVRRLNEAIERKRMPALVLRSHAQVARLFDGLDLVEPGIVPVDRWRPDETVPVPPSDSMFIYGAVGRKP